MPYGDGLDKQQVTLLPAEGEQVLAHQPAVTSAQRLFLALIATQHTGRRSIVA